MNRTETRACFLKKEGWSYILRCLINCSEAAGDNGEGCERLQSV